MDEKIGGEGEKKDYKFRHSMSPLSFPLLFFHPSKPSLKDTGNGGKIAALGDKELDIVPFSCS